jgi:hypothetical protein
MSDSGLVREVVGDLAGRAEREVGQAAERRANLWVRADTAGPTASQARGVGLDADEQRYGSVDSQVAPGPLQVGRAGRC